MAMPKAVPNDKARVRCTVDTVLLTTLLNKELNAQGRVFNILMEFRPAANAWQLWVEHFKNTHEIVDPENLGKYDDMEKLAKKIGTKLLATMARKTKETKVSILNKPKVGDSNEPVPAQ